MKRRMRRFFAKLETRALSLLLAGVLLLSALFTSMSLAGFVMPEIVHAAGDAASGFAGATLRDDALHFVIRHWHTAVDSDATLNGIDDDDPATDQETIQKEAATNSYFVLVEGYIVPIKGAKADDKEQFEFYLVNQATQELVSVYKEGTDHENKEFASGYVVDVKADVGDISIRVKPLSADGDEIEVFSGFSVSTGRSSISTDADDDGVVRSVTVHYGDGLTHLAKGHVFYTHKRETVPGTNDPAVFDANESEIDVAYVYTYSGLDENGEDCAKAQHKNSSDNTAKHYNGEIVKYTVDREDAVCSSDEDLLEAQNQGEPVKYKPKEGDANGPATDANGNIEWTNVTLIKYYSTNEGLHTDKTLMQAADGRIFLFDLQTWYTEGYSAQLSFLVDASGSMAFSFDEPGVMNVYGVLAEKLGAQKQMVTTGVNTTYHWTYGGDKVNFPANDAQLPLKLRALFELILRDRGVLKTQVNVAENIGEDTFKYESQVNYDPESDIVNYNKLAELLSNATGSDVTEAALQSLFGKIGLITASSQDSDWNKAFLGTELNLLLNPRNTDNSSLGTNGYSYYVYSDEGNNGIAYVPLGYWQGGEWSKEGEDESNPYTFEIDETKESGDVVSGWPKQYTQDGIKKDYIGMSSTDGFRVTNSDRGIILDAQPTTGAFTLSFLLRAASTTSDSDPTNVAQRNIKEILYIGPLSGNVASSSYYRLFRNGGADSNWLLGSGKSESGDFVTGIGSIFPSNQTTTTAITLVFDGTKVSSYVNGTFANATYFQFADDNDINVVINGIQDSYSGMEIDVDEIYVLKSALSASDVRTLSSQIKAVPRQNAENIVNFAKNNDDVIGIYTFTNGSVKPLKNDTTSRDWLKNSAPSATRNNTQYTDDKFNTGKVSSFAYALKAQEDGKWQADFGSNGNSFSSTGSRMAGGYLIAQTSTGVDLGAVCTSDSNTVYTDLGAGWYFVSHAGAVDFYKTVGSGKRLQGLPSTAGGAVTLYDMLWYQSDTSKYYGGSTNATYTLSSNSASLFYIDANGNLRCFSNVSGTINGNTPRCSYVYQLEDKQYSRVEMAQRILANFSTRFSDLSPTSYLSAVRFSSDKYDANSHNEQILLDWSNDPKEVANIMSNTRGHVDEATGESTVGKVNGYTTSQRGVEQYNYVLTGSTDTYKGLVAYAEYLHGGTDKGANSSNYDYKIVDGNKTSYYKLDGHCLKDPDAPKFIVIFTDGANTGNLDDAKKLATAFKREGYTIVGVLFAGDAMNDTSLTTAETFFKSVVGTKDESGNKYLNKYYFKASRLDDLITLFDEQIMAQIVDSLTGYNIQEYVDSRFDLEQGDGVVWHLGANGTVVAEGTGSKNDTDNTSLKNLTDRLGAAKVSYERKFDGQENYEGPTIRFSVKGGVPFHIYEVTVVDEGNLDKGLSEITSDARDPKLYFDATKDAYYLQWTDQSLPTSQVGSVALMPVWSVTILLSAKDDFIGGNAILTEGNGAFENWVYHPLDLNVGDGEDYENLTVQQQRNLAEEEQYIELRRDQYAKDWAAYDSSSKPTITQDKYAQAHLAEYLWKNLGNLSNLEALKDVEGLKSLDLDALKDLNDEKLQVIVNEIGTLVGSALTIKGTVTSTLAKKYDAILTYQGKTQNYKPSISKDDYIKRDQAEYLYEHLASLSGISEAAVSAITEAITNVLKVDFDKFSKGYEDLFGNTRLQNNDGSYSATVEEYVTFKLAENTSKKTDHDASSGIKDRIKNYWPENTKWDDEKGCWVAKTNDTANPQDIYIHYDPKTGDFSVTYDPEGTQIVPREKYERDWNNPIDARISKGFPRATVNVQLKELDVIPLYHTLYMGEVVSPAQLLTDIEDSIITDSYYLEYLKRYAYQRYLYSGATSSEEANTPLLTLLNEWLQFKNEEVYEKSFSIPYMYLPAVDYDDETGKITSGITNSSGFNNDTYNGLAFDQDGNPLADVVGILTYRWEMIEPDPTKTAGADATTATKNYVKDDTERMIYAVTVGFTPMQEGDILGELVNGSYENSGYWLNTKTGDRFESKAEAQDSAAKTLGESDYDGLSEEKKAKADAIVQYVPSLNEYDDDGEPIFAGYLRMDSKEGETSSWDRFEFDREKIVNGKFIQEKDTKGNTVFKWNPEYKPAVYEQQLQEVVKGSAEENPYTATEETVQLINNGRDEKKNADDEIIVEANEFESHRTLKGYSVYTMNIVSGDIILEFKLQTGELELLLETKAASYKVAGAKVYALNDEGDGGEGGGTASTCALDEGFILEAERSFTDQEFAENLKEEENLLDYGDTFTLTFKFDVDKIKAQYQALKDKKDGKASAESVTPLEEDKFGFVKIYAKAEEIKGTFGGEEIDDLYEHLPIGSYTFKLSDANKQGNALLQTLRFGEISYENQESASFTTAYDQFNDVVLRGLHTRNERIQTSDGYTYELAQKRDEKGRLLYMTDKTAYPYCNETQGYKYDSVNYTWKDKDGNVVWQRTTDRDGRLVWQDGDENTIYYYDETPWTDVATGEEYFGVWRYEENGFMVPNSYHEDEVYEIVSDNIDGFVAEAYKNTEQKTATFYMGTTGARDDSKLNNEGVSYSEARVGIVVLSSGTTRLTIVEDGENSKPTESFLYQITGTTLSGVDVDITVSVKGGNHTTVDIVAGEYTVTEISSWSWRYEVGTITKAVEWKYRSTGDNPVWNGIDDDGYGYTAGTATLVEEWIGNSTDEKLENKRTEEATKASGWTGITQQEGLADSATIKLYTDTYDAVVTFTHARNEKTWVGGEWYEGIDIPAPKQKSAGAGN